MADQKLRIVIDTLFKSKGIDKAQKELGELDKQAKRGKSSLGNIKDSLGSVAIAAGTVGGALVVAKQAFDFGKEGAQIKKVQKTFDDLAVSVGSSSNTMLASLQRVTQGMVSDTDLMASANRFLAMGLAESSDQAAELARVAVTLGGAMGKDATSAMEEFALLMANQSIPRLDTFGISAGKVRTRINELMDANKDLTREGAFNQAVMEQARISMEKLGDAVPVDEFTQFEVSLKNITDNAKVSAAEGLGPLVGFLDDALPTITKINRMLAAGGPGFLVESAIFNPKAFEDAAELEDIVAQNTENLVRGYKALVGDAWIPAVRVNEELNDKLAQTAGHMSAAEVATRRHQKELLKLAEAEKEAAERADELARLRLDAFTGALEDTGKPLKFFNETLEELGPQMVFFGGRTADQNRILSEAEDKYKRLDREIVDYQIGLAGLGLTEAERSEKIGELVSQQQELVPIMNDLNSIHGTANMVVQEATINQDALSQALYDQLTTLEQTPEQLALAAGALGLYNDQQLEAALKAAALAGATRLVADAIVAGDISAQNGLGALKDFAAGNYDSAEAALEHWQEMAHMNEQYDEWEGQPDEVTKKATIVVEGLGRLKEAIDTFGEFYDVGAGGVPGGGGRGGSSSTGSRSTGGGTYSTDSGRVGGRQHGGHVGAGGMFLVGERGPELFMPSGSGHIVPNQQLNMGGITVNVTAGGGNPYAIGQEVGKAVRDIVLGSGMRG